MSTLAEQECRRLGWAFVESFKNQYTITEATQDGPEGWAADILGPWRVSHCKDLPKTELTFKDGSVVGIVLGYAISPDGMMLEGKHKLPISARSAAALMQAEQYIAELAGRYVILLSIGTSSRVYGDPMCSMGPVYNAKQRCLGTSTALTVDRPLIDNPDVSAQSVSDGEAQYRFGQTADRDVKRAIPNHYIDLRDFSSRRFWPTEDTSFKIGERARKDVSLGIGQKLRANMKALIERYPTALPMSGNTDSRLLLSVASDMLDQISQIFVSHTNGTNDVDTEIAWDIARELSFPLRVISPETQRFKSNFPEQDHADHMQLRHLRGGFEPETTDINAIKTMQMVPSKYIILQDNVVELSRALRWKRAMFNDPHNTQFALRKIGVTGDTDSAIYKTTEAAFLRWKETLPDSALPRIYDLLHTEIWLPHTKSAAYARAPEHMFVDPYNDRRLIHLTTSIPPFMRKNRRIVDDIVFNYAKDIYDIDYARERTAKRNQQDVA